jgi:pimeloyl-ACP methyl ester carboxylesterase
MIAVFILVLLLTLFGVRALPWLFQRLLLRGFKAPRIPILHSPPAHTRFDKVVIPTRNEKYLRGWFLPGDADAACLVILHGWGSNAEIMLPVAMPFVAAGLNVLLPNARCHGDSDEDTYSSLPRFAEDFEACISWLNAQPELRMNEVVLLGHSLGGAAALLTASHHQRVNAVISLSAFAHPRTMMQQYLGFYSIPALFRRVIIHQVQRTIGHSLDDIAPINTIRKISCPVLICHGLADTTVPPTEARLIVANAGHNRPELLLIANADHGSVELFNQHSADLVEFLARHLRAPRL